MPEQIVDLQGVPRNWTATRTAAGVLVRTHPVYQEDQYSMPIYEGTLEDAARQAKEDGCSNDETTIRRVSRNFGYPIMA